MGRNRESHSYQRSRNKKASHRLDRESTSHIRKETRRRRYSPSTSSYSSSSSSSSSSSESNSSYLNSSESVSSSTRKRHEIPHYRVRIGEKLNYRYKVKRELGDGTFGRVVECQYKDRLYAVKIIKPVERYIESARTQRSIIRRINERDPDDKWGIVRYKQCFYHRNHYCKSLYHFIKMNNYKGFPIKLIQSFFRQILRSIGFLHRIGYTHTDLKPQNILLESQDYHETPDQSSPRHKYYVPNRDTIRIIDFGGATKYDEYHSSTINTRQYRSPEVILQCCQWDQISDVWSIGCIVCELFTGELLFPTHADDQHLAMIEKMCGRFPGWMVQKTRDSSLRRLFRDGYINQDRIEHIENVVGLKSVDEVFQGYPELIDLIRRCLEIDPSRRINCMEALRHPFFQLRL